MTGARVIQAANSRRGGPWRFVAIFSMPAGSPSSALRAARAGMSGVITAAETATRPAISPYEIWRRMMTPDHPGWAKNVLLVIVWMFVLAVLIGPLERWLVQRRNPSRRRQTPGW